MGLTVSGGSGSMGKAWRVIIRRITWVSDSGGFRKSPEMMGMMGMIDSDRWKEWKRNRGLAIGRGCGDGEVYRSSSQEMRFPKTEAG
jgi:hypothetical protein